MPSPIARTAAAYMLLFSATGISLPFAALWFRSVGMTPDQIGLMLAAPMIGRVASGPLIAVWADGFRLRRTPIIWLGLLSVVGYGGAALTEPFAGRLAFWFVGATAASSTLPLLDVLTLGLAGRFGFTFALPRGFGSVAFVLANIIGGAALISAPAWIAVVCLCIAGLGLSLAAATVLPDEAVERDGPAKGLDRFRGLGDLLTDPVFMTCVLAVGLVQAAHAFQYGFSALLWTRQGLDEGLVGRLWAFGVVVEVLLMWGLEPWRRRAGVGPWLLLVVGAGAAVVRWSVMATSPPLWALWPLQASHALTFAATFLAGLQLVERLAPGARHTAGQMLSSVLSSGVLIGLATMASGPLYDRYGAGGYWLMAGMSAVGLGLAFTLPKSLRRMRGGGGTDAAPSSAPPSSPRA